MRGYRGLSKGNDSYSILATASRASRFIPLSLRKANHPVCRSERSLTLRYLPLLVLRAIVRKPHVCNYPFGLIHANCTRTTCAEVKSNERAGIRCSRHATTACHCHARDRYATIPWSVVESRQEPTTTTAASPAVASHVGLLLPPARSCNWCCN